MSVDYDPSVEASQKFFAVVQNKMHWAAHGHTAAEVIAGRADATQPNMGLAAWTGSRPRLTDGGIANRRHPSAPWIAPVVQVRPELVLFDHRTQVPPGVPPLPPWAYKSLGGRVSSTAGGNRDARSSYDELLLRLRRTLFIYWQRERNVTRGQVA
jgi:Virulence protein RhuM family